jgi:hypothetical protein
MSWCEDNGVFYCFGLARNDRLSEELKGAFKSLQAQIKEGNLLCLAVQLLGQT